MPLRVGFLGAGLIATFHSKLIRLSGLEADGLITRTGVFDPDAERAASFAQASGHAVCASEEEVFDGCDAVFVCTWTSEHRRLVEAAAARGLAIFCEKPLATSLHDATVMTHAVESAGVVNQVGLILRRSPAFAVARRLVEEPAAGRLMAVVMRDDQYLPIQGMYDSTWRADRRKAGAGTFLEHSIHDVDLLRMLCGEIIDVSARQANFHGHPGIEDVMAVTMHFLGGATGTLTSVWHDNLARPGSRRVELFTEHRMVVVDGHDWWGPVTWVDSDGTTGSMEGETLAADAASLVPGPANPVEAFLRAATSGEPAWPSFADALVAHHVTGAVYRSAHHRGELTVVETTDEP